MGTATLPIIWTAIQPATANEPLIVTNYFGERR